ncbi:hypothetical protein ACFL2H_11075 [Planctomycetota bacterium]
MRFLIALFVLLFTRDAMCQARALILGTPEEYRARVRMDSQARESHRWAGEILNNEGQTRSVRSGSTPEEIEAVIRGNVNFVPWIRIAHLRKGEYGVPSTGNYPWFPKMRVVSIVGEDEMLCQCGKSAYWIRGIGTGSLATNSEFKITEPVEFVGTKTYKSYKGEQITAFELKAWEEWKQWRHIKDAEAGSTLNRSAELAKARTPEIPALIAQNRW